MIALELHLYGGHTPELHSTIFQHPLVGKLECVRGKTAGVYVGCGTFHWSNAVKALVVLSVYTVHAHLSGLPPARLQGRGRCLARSLDLALSKQPIWLTEMFGVTSDGTSIARRIFVRSNPEGRMPGPQSIAISPSILPPDQIRVFVDEQRVSSVERTSALLLALESKFSISPLYVTERTTAHPHLEVPRS